MAPTVEIPFVLNGKRGRLAVEYKPNTGRQRVRL